MSGQDLSSMRRSKLRFSDSFASLLFGGAVLIALFAFFYVERNRTGVAPQRPASKEFLRAGSPYAAPIGCRLALLRQTGRQR